MYIYMHAFCMYNVNLSLKMILYLKGSWVMQFGCGLTAGRKSYSVCSRCRQIITKMKRN